MSESPAIRSMQIWALYTLVLGLGLLAVPNLILETFGVERTTEVWIRVLGAALLAIDMIYWSLTNRRNPAALRVTVYERVFTAAILVVLAFIHGPWQLTLFAVIEVAGASWTWIALRAER